MSENSSDVTTTKPIPSSKRPLIVAFPMLVAAAMWMAVLRGLRFENLHSGLGLMDDYWTSFYLMSYADGFRRRALIGSIVRFIEPRGANVLLINALAILVLLLLLAILSVALVRVARNSSSFSLCLAFAFCTSSLVCVYCEVLGDMLQICLVLFALAAGFALRQGSTALKIALGYCVLCLCFLIHEASIFLLAPCLPFLLHRWPRWRDFLAPAAGVVLLLAVSFVWSDLHPHLTYSAILFRHPGSLHLVVETQPFKVLLHDLYMVKFGGLKGKLLLGFKVVRIALLALAGLLALANVLPWALLRRQIYIFSAITLFSIPLWLIAEDWGRFLGYNFLLAILVTSWDYLFPLAPDLSEATLPSDTLASSLQRLGSYTFVRLAALMVLILSPFHQSRMLGMNSTSIALCLGVIFVAVAQVLGWVPDPLLNSSSEAEEPSHL